VVVWDRASIMPVVFLSIIHRAREHTPRNDATKHKPKKSAKRKEKKPLKPRKYGDRPSKERVVGTGHEGGARRGVGEDRHGVPSGRGASEGIIYR
jgi:hypothetical protein